MLKKKIISKIKLKLLDLENQPYSQEDVKNFFNQLNYTLKQCYLELQ